MLVTDGGKKSSTKREGRPRCKSRYYIIFTGVRGGNNLALSEKGVTSSMKLKRNLYCKVVN